MNRKLDSIENCDLLDEWIEKWYALCGLINNVTGPDEPPPTLADELEYQYLRFWFIDRQWQFLPLWQGACEGRDLEHFQNRTDRVWECFEGLGLCFYEPENLYRLAQRLDLQSGIDIWEPSEYVAKTVRPIFFALTGLMTEFRDGMAERLDATT